MTPETLTSPAAPMSAANAVVPPSPADRADYDQKLANEITQAATQLGVVLSNAEVLAQLSFSQAEVEAGVALQQAAQGAFNARQQAVSTERTRIDARDALLESVREDFSDFRATVQANFPGNVRTALGAGGRVPADLQKFITLVRSAYAAAQQAPYAETLAKRKLTGAVFTARLAQLDQLESLDGQAKGAANAATAATRARDEAGAALRKWMGDFRKQARVDLRKTPELRAALGV